MFTENIIKLLAKNKKEKRSPNTLAMLGRRLGRSRSSVGHLIHKSGIVDDEMCLLILTKGFKYSVIEAKDLRARWVIEKYQPDLLEGVFLKDDLESKMEEFERRLKRVEKLIG